MRQLRAPLRPTFPSPLHPGTVAHYREAVPFDSMHVCVYPDGSVTWHEDKFNPDAGPRFAAAHLASDVL